MMVSVNINGTYFYIVLKLKSLFLNSVKPLYYSVILRQAVSRVFMLSFWYGTIVPFYMVFELPFNPGSAASK